MFHWEIKNEVDELKQNGKLEDALNLLLRTIDFEENQANTTYRPLYSSPFEDAAIIYGKLKRYDNEIAILERFLSHPKAIKEIKFKKFAERLEKACIKVGKAEIQAADGVEKVFYIPENVLFEDRSLFVSNGLILDTETTGLNANTDEIIELGAMSFKYNKLKNLSSGIKETYNGLREPTVPISSGASRVNGIQFKDVKGKSLDDKTIQRLINEANFLIAHNVSFDRSFILKMFPEAGQKDWYCSMNGIRWKSYGHNSKGLQNLLSDFQINVENSHRALNDAMAVYSLLQQVNQSTQKTFLVELLSGIPEPKEDGTNRPSRTNTYTIKIELPSQKPKKSFLDLLFGK